MSEILNTEQNKNPFNWGSAIGIGAGMADTVLGELGKKEYTDETRRLLDEAVYGNSSADPIGRMVSDLTGNSTKAAIASIQNYRVNDWGRTTDQLLSNWSSTRNNPLQKYSTIKGLTGKTLAAPFLDFSGNKVKLSTDNLTASAKGAAAGSSFGPWGALVGGIAGGVFNVVSTLGRNKRIKKINRN